MIKGEERTVCRESEDEDCEEKLQSAQGQTEVHHLDWRWDIRHRTALSAFVLRKLSSCGAQVPERLIERLCEEIAVG